jgi:hypothetical protein
MGLHSRRIDELGARLDEAVGKIDRQASTRSVEERISSRGRVAQIRKLVTIGMVLAAILVATTVAGLVMDGIGLLGFFGAIALAIVAVGVIATWKPREKPLVDYKDDMTNKAVVQRLDSLLLARRNSLPAPAARQVDAISARLPQLASRLGEAETLDPLAQDARRLMGKHLPELIERYERVPAAYRAERDAEGLTVDERLVQGLAAADTALDELGRKLAREDMDAFQTQGRFIESRYKEDGPIRSE